MANPAIANPATSVQNSFSTDTPKVKIKLTKEALVELSKAQAASEAQAKASYEFVGIAG